MAGESRAGAYPAIVICNTRHVGTGMRMAPRARHDDGLMDVVLLEPATRLRTLGLLRRVYDGSHVGHPSVSYLQLEQIRLRPAHAGLLVVDGELLETDALEIEVVAKAIEVIGLP